MRIIYKLIILILVMLSFSACNYFNLKSQNAGDSISDYSTDFSLRTDGETLLSNSESFILTIYPTQILSENDSRYLVYELAVDNNSMNEYKNFTVNIKPNDNLDQYLAAGTNAIPFNIPVLAPKGNIDEDKGTGLDIQSFHSIETDGYFLEAGLVFDDIIKYAADFDIYLTWDGGEELLFVETDVIDSVSELITPSSPDLSN